MCAPWAVEALLVYADDAARASEVLVAVGTLDSDGKKENKVVRACEERRSAT